MMICCGFAGATALSAYSQDSIDYGISLSANASSGMFAPYFIGSLNHGKTTQKDAVLLDASVSMDLDSEKRFSWGFGVEAMGGFLIATPQTGVDSIAATYSMMGLPFALLRPVAALVTAVGGGALANRFARRGGNAAAVQEPEGNPDTRPAGFMARVRAAAVYGFGNMMEDIGRWLLIGLVIAALITAFVPADFLASLSDYPLLSMLLVLALSVPMYVCATGSIPIAVALMLKGLSPGAALVLLMAGPATNAASLMVVHKALGRGVQVFYVGAIVVGAMVFGLLADYFMPASWFELPMAVGTTPHEHSGSGMPKSAAFTTEPKVLGARWVRYSDAGTKACITPAIANPSSR